MIIVGCAGSPLAVSMKSSEELKMVPSRQLCAAYAYSKSRKVKAELVARDLFVSPSKSGCLPITSAGPLSRGSVAATRQAHNLENAGSTPAPANYGSDELFITLLRKALRHGWRGASFF